MLAVFGWGRGVKLIEWWKQGKKGGVFEDQG